MSAPDADRIEIGDLNPSTTLYVICLSAAALLGGIYGFLVWDKGFDDIPLLLTILLLVPAGGLTLLPFIQSWMRSGRFVLNLNERRLEGEGPPVPLDAIEFIEIERHEVVMRRGKNRFTRWEAHLYAHGEAPFIIAKSTDIDEVYGPVRRLAEEADAQLAVEDAIVVNDRPFLRSADDAPEDNSAPSYTSPLEWAHYSSHTLLPYVAIWCGLIYLGLAIPDETANKVYIGAALFIVGGLYIWSVARSQTDLNGEHALQYQAGTMIHDISSGHADSWRVEDVDMITHAQCGWHGVVILTTDGAKTLLCESENLTFLKDKIGELHLTVR